VKRRTIGDRALRPESLAMSYGYDPHLSEGAVKAPIFQTSTFVFKDAAAGKAFFELAYGLRESEPNESMGLIYSRLNNPNLEVLEDRLTLWDEAEDALVFASGMAAIGTAILAFARPGDVIVHSEPIYGGSDHFLRHVLKEFGISIVGFPAGVPFEGVRPALEAAVGERPVACVLVETPSNPTNSLVDIEAVAAWAHARAQERRAVVMVDNTFLGPIFQHPLAFGADLVLYSATKFIGGHSDLIAGAAVGPKSVVGPIRVLRTFLGTMASPWTGWLMLRSLETLKMRMTAQMKNARYVAEFLAEHPKVAKVHYLGLLTENDPMFGVYRRQCMAPGSMVSFDVRGGEAEAFRFLDALQMIKLAVSLGGTESLAEHPATMTHADIPHDLQRRMGIGAGMVRLSVGVEHYEDIIADIDQALGAV
jgi:methionine-gamma-lyase